MPSKSGRARRSVYLGFAVVLLMLGLRPAAPSAREGTSQGPFFVSGRNVNTVGLSPAPGTPNPGLVGDPLFKQQNEVDCDVSPNDVRLVFCANNDYRGIEAFGDSWIGVTMSDDGGLTWKSRLHPGFPATTGTGVGAADPVVATVPGLGLVGFITISRTDNRGTLRLGRWLERNKENGERYTHLDTVVIGSGTPGRFADKPAMVAVLSPEGLGGGVTTVGDRTVPNGVIHFGYAIFPGNANNSSSEIYHLMSTDYGKTWSNPKKLSESVGINQGIDFAVGGNTVVATWRRIKDGNEPDSIMFARSTDGGKTWSKASVLSPGTFFDQDSSDLQFRTRSMPSIVHDGTAFHVFWSARGTRRASDEDPLKVDARVVVSSSADGATWPALPTVVDDYLGRGHQLMPTAAVAGGRVQVNWIDSRNNLAGSFGATLADIVYDNSASASGKKVYRQSVDVFAAQAPSGASLGFGVSQQVSRYRTGIATLPDKPPAYGQLEYNFVNARMFKQGAWPFHGDYHAVAGQRYRPSPVAAGAWIPNTTAPDSDSHAVFYSAFTDNRDVRGYVWASPTNSTFTPPPGAVAQGESGSEVYASCNPNPETPTDVWDPGNSPRSRDQNIYAAATLPGLLVESPSGSKPTGNLGRAYAITVYNLTDRTTNYRLSIANQPGGGSASWERCEEGTCVTQSIISTVTPRSSISRTVYVVSTELRPRIVVSVAEQAPLAGPTAQTGSVILNADPNAPQIEQPEGNLAQIIDQELYQPAILTRQVTSYSTALLNPDVVPVWSTGTAEAPRIDYPRIDYPRIDYPRIDYPRIDYSSPANPRIDYPRIDYPRIDYQSIENPRIDYSALSSDTVTEITWPVTTSAGGPTIAANTTTAMTAMVFVNGGLPAGTGAQLLVTVPYTTAAANSCDPVAPSTTLVDNQVIVSYKVEDLAKLTATSDGVPNVVNPNPWQPSFPVKPGQTVWVTLRLRGVNANLGELLARRTGLWVRAQPDTAANNGRDEARDGEIDVTAPEFSPTNPEVLGTGEATGPGGGVVTYDLPAATDVVDGAPVVACTPVSGSSFALGPSTVNCTATDASLNSTTAPFKVMVVDTTPPIVTVPADISTKEATGSGGAVVTFSVTASDIVDPTPTIACVPASGSTFSLGTTTVTCTAKDAAGNISAPSSFTVAVRDVTPPVLTVPANMTVNAASSGTVVVSYAPTATDAVDPTPTIACVPASRSMFSVGTTTVTCTAKDAAGNISAPSSFTVTVRDVTPPVLTVPANMTVNAASSGTVVVSYTPTATDAVDPAPTIACVPASGSTFSVGTTTVTCTAKDAAGNISAPSSFTVAVRDVTPPVIVEAATPTILIWSPNKIMTPVRVYGSITDATTVRATYAIVDEYKTYSTAGKTISVAPDGTYSFTVSLEAWRTGTDSDGRTYTIIVTAVDGAGNTASKSVVVKVPHNS